MAIPSLALIPTGFKDGKLYSVLPESGAGDFSVTRGSGATRVNKDGFIEDVRILSGELIVNGDFEQLGSELVTNGDFSDGSTDWIFNSGSTLTDKGAKITHTPSAGQIVQYNSLVIGKNYKFTYEITESISGGLKLNSAVNTLMATSVGVHTKDFEADETSLIVARSNAASNDVTIDNISVKEVAQDWTLSAGWSVADGKAVYDGSGGTSQIRQFGVVQSGKKYRLTLDVLANEGSGANTIFLGGLQVNTGHLDVGSYTFVGTATSTTSLNIYGRTGEVFEIDNISIIEINEDTDIPRLDYTDGGCPVLLTEPQSTNLITYSEDFSQSNWTKNQATLTSDSTSPSGALNATKFVATGTDMYARTLFNVGVGDFTQSVYIKGVGSSIGKSVRFRAHLIGTATGSSTDTFPVITGDWQRIENSFSITGAGTMFFRLDMPDTSALGEEVLLWGAQAEALSHSTSYIPTSGAIATRLADKVTGAGDASTFNSTEGVLYFEGSALENGGVNRYISISDSTSSNRRQLVFSSTSNRIQVSGTNITTISYNSFVQNNNNKIAVSYSPSGVKLYVNGVLVGSNTDDASLPANALTTLDFSLWNQTSVPFFGKTKDLRVYNTALTGAELITLTTI